MYKSPIELHVMMTDVNRCVEGIIKERDKAVEQEVIKSIISSDVHIDKEELIKALQYDRNQYSKGFADGVRKVADRLKQCRMVEEETLTDEGIRYGYACDDVDKIIAEMVGEGK